MTDASTPMPEALCTVACPQCGAGYQVPVAKLAEKPRKLKCAQCAQVWLASLPAPEAAAPSSATPMEAAQDPTPAPEPTAEPTSEPEAPTEAPAEEVEDIPPPAPMPLDAVLTPAWHAYVFGEQKWLTLAMLMVLVGLGAAVAALRLTMLPPVPEEIEIHTPTQKARLMKPVPAPQGVVLHNVEAQAVQTAAGIELTLQGRIANTGNQNTALPHLQAELLDEGGVVQDFWPVPLVTTTLPAQTELPFAVSFTNPLGQGWRLVWVN